MVALLPTAARLVKEAWLDRVPSPAYDSLTPGERRAFRLTHPESFLNVTRSPEDEEPGVPVDPAQLLREGRAALDHLLDVGAFDDSDAPALFLYRLIENGHEQVGVVGEVPVAAYASGEIRIHEEVRQARADLLADHFDVVGAASSPVALAFRGSDEIAATIDRLVKEQPVLDFSDDTGLRQTVWRVVDPLAVADLGAALADEPMYIIDGHHRAAAALTACERNEPGSPLEGMLVAAFPDDSLRLLGFNRWVRDVDNDLIASLHESLPQLSPSSAMPELCLGTVGLYARGAWYRLDLDLASDMAFDAVAVRTELLGPIFGVERSDDPRLVNLAGDQSIEGLVETVDRLGGVAIVMAPIELDAFMAAADAGVVLPPKSTYFTPKVRSGLFLRLNH